MTTILTPGYELTLRPMKYPQFYEMYRNGIRNTWTVEEVDFAQDLVDLKEKLSTGEVHMIKRLVAFFATGDSIVSNNLVINFYQNINSPEARMYLSRQLYEEALHVQFYLTLLDSYIPDMKEREEMFAAIHNVESIQRKGEFAIRNMKSVEYDGDFRPNSKRKTFLRNLICYSCCIEGLFFFGAFAYIYFLRSKGLLPGLASGTNWVFRDESMHMNFAFEVIKVIREEEPNLWDKELEEDVKVMVQEAVALEKLFCLDVLQEGVMGLSYQDMSAYLEFIADQRLQMLGIEKLWGSKNPFPFMDLQDVQSLTNFFERRVADYQVGIQGEVSFGEEF